MSPVYLSFLISVCLFLPNANGLFGSNGLKPPSKFQVDSDSVTDTSLLLIWTAAPKADSYKIFVEPPTITISGAGSNILNPFADINGLNPDTEYKFTLFAVHGDSQSSPTVITQRTALSPPRSASVIQDSLTHDSMVVRWTPVIGKIYYTVTLQPSAGTIPKKIYSVQTKLENLSPNTRYTITVFAVNWVGNGGEISIQQTTKLPPPQNLRVVQETITPTMIGVRWDEVISAYNYVVKYSSDVEPQQTQDTFLVLTDLKPATEYVIKVATRNSAGVSEFQRISARTLSECFITARASRKTEFRLNCPAYCAKHQSEVYGTNVYTSDSYVCAAAIHDGRIDNGAGGVVSVKKKQGINYFKGSTRHGITSRNYAFQHPAFVFGLQPPNNLTVLSVFSNKFTLRWNPVRGADQYRVTILPNNEEIIQRVTKVEFPGLEPNTTYTVNVIAFASDEASEVSVITQTTALPAPKNLHVNPSSVSSDSFTVTWDALQGANHYEVQVISSEQLFFLNSTTNNQITIRNLPGGTLFSISVTGANNIGSGLISTINQTTVLQPPSNLNVTTATYNSLSLTWEKVDGATFYLLSVKPCCFNATITGNVYLLENLTSNTDYEIGVKSGNAMNSSILASVVRHTTALDAPGNLRVQPETLTRNSAVLMWDPLLNSNLFTIKVSGLYSRKDEMKFTNNSFIRIQDLSPGTRYFVSVMGKSSVGYGRQASLNFTTLLSSPKVTRMEYNQFSNELKFFWDTVPMTSLYNVSANPSARISGTGSYKARHAALTGFRANTTYSVLLEARSGSLRSKPVRIPFDTRPKATPVIAAFVWEGNSVRIRWKAIGYRVYRIVLFENRLEVERRTTNVGDTSVVFGGLSSFGSYKLKFYAVPVSNLTAATVVQMVTIMEAPVVSSVQRSKSGAFNATFTWLSGHPGNEFQLALSSGSNLEKNKYKESRAHVLDLRKDFQYILGIKPIGQENYKSIDFSWDSFPKYDGIPVTLRPFDSNGDDADPFDNDILNKLDSSDSPTKSSSSESSRVFWIAIAVVIGAIVILFLVICISCVCVCKKRPLIRNHGLCGCCR